MSKATESMFDGKGVIIPLAEVSYILKFLNCIEVHFKGSAESVTLVQPDQNALISAWCRYRSEVEADTLMDLAGAHPAPSLASGDASLISAGKTHPAQSVKDDIIDDLQSQFDTEGITGLDSGDALIRLSDAIAAVEDNFALAPPAPSVPGGMVERAVTRFLSWKLPKDFHPDGGVVFIPTKGRGYDSPYWPCGTNLLNAQQARDLLRYVLAAAPEAKP